MRSVWIGVGIVLAAAGLLLAVGTGETPGCRTAPSPCEPHQNVSCPALGAVYLEAGCDLGAFVLGLGLSVTGIILVVFGIRSKSDSQVTEEVLARLGP